jgi:hypothetical protein
MCRSSWIVFDFSAPSRYAETWPRRLAEPRGSTGSCRRLFRKPEDQVARGARLVRLERSRRRGRAQAVTPSNGRESRSPNDARRRRRGDSHRDPARAASGVTSSGLASSVISDEARTSKRRRMSSSNAARSGAGVSEGVPPPRYTESIPRPGFLREQRRLRARAPRYAPAEDSSVETTNAQ